MDKKENTFLYPSLILLIFSALIFGFTKYYKNNRIEKLQSELENMLISLTTSTEVAFKQISQDPNIGPIDKKYMETLILTAPSPISKSDAYLNAFTDKPHAKVWKEFSIPVQKILEEKDKEATINNLTLEIIKNLNNKIDAIGDKMLSRWDVFIVVSEIIFIFAAICAIMPILIGLIKKIK